MKLVETGAPEGANLLEPFRGFVDGFEIEGVDAALGVDLDGDELRFAQDFEMLGDGGRGGGEVGLDFGGGFWALGKEFDDALAGGVGHGGEGVHRWLVYQEVLN